MLLLENNKRSFPSYYRGPMQSLAEQRRVRIFVNFGFTKERGLYSWEVEQDCDSLMNPVWDWELQSWCSHKQDIQEQDSDFLAG